jgi:hypothetical protein
VQKQSASAAKAPLTTNPKATVGAAFGPIKYNNLGCGQGGTISNQILSMIPSSASTPRMTPIFPSCKSKDQVAAKILLPKSQLEP